MKSETSPGPRAEPARLIVTDDHELVRNGLQRMLAREQDLEVVGEAANGREALELCRRVRPDLVLMDVRMPEMDGLAATRAIKEEQPSTSVLILTTHENPDYLFEALKAGAAGYVLKDVPKRELISAIRGVLSGESALNQELAARLIQRLASEDRREAESPPEPKKRQESSLELLTPRELEILRELARGLTNPDIARNLVISRGTVKIHVQHIISKLGVSDRTQAVVRALDLGLLSSESGAPEPA